MSRRARVAVHDAETWRWALDRLGTDLDLVNSQGALRATLEGGTLHHEGRLPGTWSEILRRVPVSAAVLSYYTPIAVRVECSDGAERWLIPGVRYSTTTSRHQNMLARALRIPPIESTEEALALISGDPALAGPLWSSLRYWRRPLLELVEVLRGLQGRDPAGPSIYAAFLDDTRDIDEALELARAVAQ